MTGVLGPVLLLGVMVWVLRTMAYRPRRNPHHPKRRYERPPRRWWRAAQWVPAGYALTKLVGSGAPLSLVLVLAVLLAAVHRALPGPFEVVTGGGGLAVALAQAVQGDGCRTPIGPGGLVLLAAFGVTAALLCLASGVGIGGLRAGQYLVAACGVTELVLFAVSPGGASTLASTGALPTGFALTASLVAALLVGLRPSFGLAVLGGGLIVAEATLAAAPGACDRSALYALVGSATFAATRLLLSSRRTRQLVGVR